MIGIFVVSESSGSPDVVPSISQSVPAAESAAAAKLSVSEIGDRVAYQVLRNAEFDQSYTSDIRLEALILWGEASGQPGYLAFVRQANRDRKLLPGSDPLSYRRQIFSNLSFEIYKRFGSPGYIERFLSETRKYQTEALRAYDGVISYYFSEHTPAYAHGVEPINLDPRFTPILIDSAQEYASRLAKAGALSRDPAFYRESAEQFRLLRAALRDPESGLWNHGRGWYTSPHDVTTTKWSRAQAWMLRGLVEALSYLPRDSQEHQQVAAILTELAQSLLRYQDDEGFWHQVVDRPESYQETSATAFISYYFARSICQGLLPERPYRQASTKAFEALIKEKVSAEGAVYGTCEMTPPLRSVGEYLRRSTPLNDPHGVAAVLFSAAGQLAIAGDGAARAPLPGSGAEIHQSCRSE